MTALADELVQWLGAQLDEHERITRAATPGPWWYNPGKQWLGPEAFEKYDLRQGEEFVGYGGPHPFTGAVAATGPANNPQSMRDAEFIAAHHPGRVLRDIDVKRQNLAELKAAEEAMDEATRNRDTVRYNEVRAGWTVLKRVARRDAAGYADRPGYREEWRP